MVKGNIGKLIKIGFLQWIHITGWWQLRLWLPNHTLRLSCERKSENPGPIMGGWSK